MEFGCDSLPLGRCCGLKPRAPGAVSLCAPNGVRSQLPVVTGRRSMAQWRAMSAEHGLQRFGQGQGRRPRHRLARQGTRAHLRRTGRRRAGRVRRRLRHGGRDRARFAQKHGVRVFGSVAEAAAASDAVSIVTPTTTHFELAKSAAPAGQTRAGRKADDRQRRAGRRTGPARAAADTASCRSATSSGSIPSSTTSKPSPPTRASSRRTGSRPTRPAARTSAWCST